jgi:hypothetical protein
MCTVRLTSQPNLHPSFRMQKSHLIIRSRHPDYNLAITDYFLPPWTGHQRSWEQIRHIRKTPGRQLHHPHGTRYRYLFKTSRNQYSRIAILSTNPNLPSAFVLKSKRGFALPKSTMLSGTSLTENKRSNGNIGNDTCYAVNAKRFI